MALRFFGTNGTPPGQENTRLVKYLEYLLTQQRTLRKSTLIRYFGLNHFFYGGAVHRILYAPRDLVLTMVLRSVHSCNHVEDLARSRYTRDGRERPAFGPPLAPRRWRMYAYQVTFTGVQVLEMRQPWRRKDGGGIWPYQELFDVELSDACEETLPEGLTWLSATFFGSTMHMAFRSVRVRPLERATHREVTRHRTFMGPVRGLLRGRDVRAALEIALEQARQGVTNR